jgi:hypothetical protein
VLVLLGLDDRLARPALKMTIPQSLVNLRYGADNRDQRYVSDGYPYLSHHYTGRSEFMSRVSAEPGLDVFRRC